MAGRRGERDRLARIAIATGGKTGITNNLNPPRQDQQLPRDPNPQDDRCLNDFNGPAGVFENLCISLLDVAVWAKPSKPRPKGQH